MRRLCTALILLSLVACDTEPAFFGWDTVGDVDSDTTAAPDATADPDGSDPSEGDTSEGDASEGDVTQDASEGDVTQDATPELMLRSPFADEASFEVETRGIFAFWWDPRFDHSGDVDLMYDRLETVRRECLDALGMADPPNPAAGYFYNVYIHHGDEDAFPNGWGNGQGTDELGMPFLTLPNGAHADVLNVYHEGFHIFQYQATSPGFAYTGDSQWYIEATAQWFAAKNFRDDVNAFVEVAALSLNPHLTLWHSFSNEAPGDPTDWLFQVRQYGMHAYLLYLTEEADVDPSIISRGFYEGTELSPQRYHYEAIGGEQLRSIFADWAAHNTGGFDYLTPEQWQRAIQEADFVGDPDNRAPFAIEVSASDLPTSAAPEPRLVPRPWSYNVARIALDGEAASIDLRLTGEATGATGDAAHFEWRAVIVGASGPRYIALPMTDATNGSASIEIVADDTEAYVVIASVPESFGGNATYPYTLTFARL